MASFVEPFTVATGCTIRDRAGHSYRVGEKVEPKAGFGDQNIWAVTRIEPNGSLGETRTVQRSIIWSICTLVSPAPDPETNLDRVRVRHRSRNSA